jgi:uncharacterized repeat protein (TIGR01451 family)
VTNEVKPVIRAFGFASLVGLFVPTAALAGTTDTVVVNLPTLPPGKTVVVRFSATVNLPFPIGDEQVMTQGTVAGSNFSPLTTDDPDAPGMSDPTVTPIDAAPDLVITKSDGVTTVAPGATTAYTLGVANVGDQAAANVLISDQVPADTTFNAALSTPGWSCPDGSMAGTLCQFGLGTLPVSAMPTTVTFAVNVVAIPMGTDIVNTATVADDGANGPDRNPLDNSATDIDTLVFPEADVSIAKTDGQDQVIAGATTEYTITVSNAGPDDVTGATVTDTPPAELTDVSWTCTPSGGATCSASGTDDINDTVDLPAGSSVVYTLTATVDPGMSASVANTATVTVPAGTNDPDLGNNTATDTNTIETRPTLGDFNGDGRSDIALHNTVTGEVREWLMDGLVVGSEVVIGTQANLAARIVGTGDYDGDGRSDLLWEDPFTSVQTWLNGTTAGPALPAPPAGFTVAGSGDYDGNGSSDIVWFNEATRKIVLWLMSGGNVMTAQQVTGLGPNRSIGASAEDYNNDGRSDLFLLNSATLMTRVRFMDGVNPTVVEDTGVLATPGWDVVGTGNYGTDPYADVLWHRPGADRPELWMMNGSAVEMRGMADHGVRGGRVEVAGSGDYDGDGQADVLWIDPDTGGLRVWLMDGFQVTAVGRLGRPPSPESEWTVVRTK